MDDNDPIYISDDSDNGVLECWTKTPDPESRSRSRSKSAPVTFSGSRSHQANRRTGKSSVDQIYRPPTNKRSHHKSARTSSASSTQPGNAALRRQQQQQQQHQKIAKKVKRKATSTNEERQHQQQQHDMTKIQLEKFRGLLEMKNKKLKNEFNKYHTPPPLPNANPAERRKGPWITPCNYKSRENLISFVWKHYWLLHINKDKLSGLFKYNQYLKDELRMTFVIAGKHSDGRLEDGYLRVFQDKFLEKRHSIGVIMIRDLLVSMATEK